MQCRRMTQCLIKPLQGADGELKLTDFGLGVFFKPGERFRDLVGSPYYVAPEVGLDAYLIKLWLGAIRHEGRTAVCNTNWTLPFINASIL